MPSLPPFRTYSIDMPWTPDDADKHYGGLSPAEKKKWAHVANAALDEYHDEGRAIRTANAAVNKGRRRKRR